MLLKISVDTFRNDDGTYDDVRFAKQLLAEESVLVLPGECFHAPGYLRLVITAPHAEQQRAWDRIESFCERYSSERKMTDSPKDLDAYGDDLKQKLHLVTSHDDLVCKSLDAARTVI